jgi:predicted nucleotidyltransferase
MKRELEIEQMIKQTLLEFAPQLKGYKILFFGSRANSNAKHHSDFDIGILGSSSLPANLFFAIEDALDKLPTLYKIDWVNLNLVSEQFLENALKEVKVIYE